MDIFSKKTQIIYRLFLSLFMCHSAGKACTVGIVADDTFQAYIDGVLVAEGNIFANQMTTAVSSDAQILALKVINNNQASGLLVMTSAQYMFYSHGNSSDWRCTAQSYDDSDLQWTAPEFDDTSWDFAHAIAEYRDDNTTWASYRGAYDIADIRAHWIWTSNPGQQGMSEIGTDTQIYCRAPIPQSCSNYQEPVYDAENCEANGGRLVGSRHCIQYVPGNFSWGDAKQDASDKGGILAPISDASYQEAAMELLIASQTPIAWIGARGTLQHNANAWEWIPPCCGRSATTTLELYDQGCYSESLAVREFAYRVNLTGLPSLTPSLCIEECVAANYIYAAVQSGSECFCSNSFGTHSVVPSCTLLCPGSSTVTCGGFGANRIYRSTGAYSPWWLEFQPDNDQTDSLSTLEDYEYCAALALYRDQPTDTAYESLGLSDRLCSETQYFACEVPSDSVSHCDRQFTYEGTIRCIHIDPSLQLSWYKARQYCQGIDEELGGGDLMTIEDSTVYNEILTHMNHTSLDIELVWVGLSKNPWSWEDTGEPIGKYNAFAGNEPVSKSQECVAIDADSSYDWTTHSCDAQQIYKKYGYFILTAVPTTSTSTTTSTSITTTPTTTSSTTTATPTTTTLPTTMEATTEVTSETQNEEETRSLANPTTVYAVETTDSFSTVTSELPTTSRAPEVSVTSQVAPTGGGNSQQSASRQEDDSLSNTQIAIIVVVLLVVLIIAALILIFCYYKNKNKKVAPSSDKYDARPQAILAYGGNLGENPGSLFTVSDSGSTSGLLAHSEMEYSLYPESASRLQSGAAHPGKIYVD